jgi:hypothetical protein
MPEPRKAKRTAAKPSAPVRVKKSIIMSAEQARLLEVYAASLGRDQSDVISEALRPILQGFYWVLDRTKRAEPPVIQPDGLRAVG